MINGTLRQIEYACAVGRFGGVTAAAEALHVSQPALSVALGQLEAALGQPLFQRRAGGRVVPTAFGRGWLAEAQAQLGAMERLMAGAVVQAPVRLACFEDLAPALLARVLRGLEGTGIAVEPAVLGFEAITEGLRLGRIDLALTWDLGLGTEVARQVLTRVVPHAVLAIDHPLLRRRRSVTLAELAEVPLILTDQGLSVGHIRGLFSQAGLSPRIAHRTASLELMRSFAANGLGVGISYARPLARHSHDGQRVMTLPISDAGSEPVVLAHHAGHPPTGAAHRLVELLPALLPFGREADSMAASEQDTA
ncbi:LysR family transcriptional regulator [Paragemmobacter straminiformis]|uniref:LysR family transcriptional regulator n=1 Tax=Paragemmobacter straminiformis TaxID=2045119 RepID=A0A842I6T6_9RHOB|nr:LysR family transcriptional regulator [Gemmobacter straminiformis]MBC2835560.1 LysR family transcriptional regulator [Gemmobacter straminiformis]